MEYSVSSARGKSYLGRVDETAGVSVQFSRARDVFSDAVVVVPEI